MVVMVDQCTVSSCVLHVSLKTTERKKTCYHGDGYHGDCYRVPSGDWLQEVQELKPCSNLAPRQAQPCSNLAPQHAGSAMQLVDQCGTVGSFCFQ